MTEISDWQRLSNRLDRAEADGRKFTFWWRDDDAVLPTPALDRLLRLAGDHNVPLTLAVIPEHTGEALAARLADLSDVAVAVHGWSHENHASAGQKKQELGNHRPPSVVLAQLRAGYERLQELHPSSFVPLLVPPWNRIDQALVAQLPALGFAALSTFGDEREDGIAAVNTHVDVMDWHGTRGCREYGAIVSDIVARIDRIGTRHATIGLLTHHLVHDDRVWLFLERLFDLAKRHAGCRFADIRHLTDR